MRRPFSPATWLLYQSLFLAFTTGAKHPDHELVIEISTALCRASNLLRSFLELA